MHNELEAQWAEAEPVSLTFHSSHQISVHFGIAISEKKILKN
jgi:hypothetical protein